MDTEITGLCRDHSFETADAVCRRCGHEFCEICVVHPFGPKKPFCKECAMVEGGVRNMSARPALPSRLIRKRVKAFDKKMADMTAAVVPEAPVIVDPVLEDWLERTPAKGESDTPDAPEEPSAPAPAPTPSLTSPDEPADGVAPPIDWNKPFG